MSKDNLKIRSREWWKERVGREVLYVSKYSILPPLRGTIHEVNRKNVRIEDDWKWIPDIVAADTEEEKP